MNQEIIPYSVDDTALAAVSEAQRVVLTQQTPKEAVLTRKGKGGKTFSYVPHAWVTEMLNDAFGWAWSWEIVEWRLVPADVDPREVFVLGRLTVHGMRGDLTKTQFGSSDVKRDRSGGVLSIGDDLKAASSDALKKCASLLGIALDLYKSEAPPSADDETVSTDPMTAYWAAAKAKELTQAEGQANLQQHGNDPGRALKALVDSNGQRSKREKIIARLRELAAESTALGQPVSLDQSWLDTATEAELTAYGLGLGKEVERLRPPGPDLPAEIPTTGNGLLAYLNDRENGHYEFRDIHHLRGAIRQQLGSDWDWPPPADVEQWKSALIVALEHEKGKLPEGS